ncbi:MAG: septum formation initiator family protein [Vampirovibrio sp.]|nr:septum formation initiator family protein [Vampirovibrio sp.]
MRAAVQHQRHQAYDPAHLALDPYVAVARKRRLLAKHRRPKVRFFSKTTLQLMAMVAMIFIFSHALITAVSGSVTLIKLQRQHTKVQQAHQQTLVKNQEIKNTLSVYTSPAGIEELARNNLEMVGEDEVLVRIY